MALTSDSEGSFAGVVRTPVYLQVAAQIRAAIFEGRFGPGESLPTERELAEACGAGRPSVREALRALQAEGLIITGGAPTRAVVARALDRPARDALVNLLRLKRVDVGELIDLRRVIEAAALRRAAERRDGARLDEARQAIADMSAEGISLAAFDEADVRFHVALVRASGNEAMHLMMLALRDPVAEHLLAALTDLPDPRAVIARLIDEHQAILEAIEAADGDRGAALIEEHIRAFYDTDGRPR
jgi:DNA-binding FadR family transcriptional regulator